MEFQWRAQVASVAVAMLRVLCSLRARRAAQFNVSLCARNLKVMRSGGVAEPLGPLLLLLPLLLLPSRLRASIIITFAPNAHQPPADTVDSLGLTREMRLCPLPSLPVGLGGLSSGAS